MSECNAENVRGMVKTILGDERVDIRSTVWIRTQVLGMSLVTCDQSPTDTLYAPPRLPNLIRPPLTPHPYGTRCRTSVPQ